MCNSLAYCIKCNFTLTFLKGIVEGPYALCQLQACDRAEAYWAEKCHRVIQGFE